MTDLERGPSTDGESAICASSLNKSPDPHSIVEKLIRIADASRRDDGSDIPLGEQCRQAAAIISELQAERDAHRLMSEKNYALWARERDARIAAESSLSRIQSETVERVISICEKLKLDFLNPTYAVDQPHSSFAERFAVQNVISAIRSSLTDVGEAKTAESGNSPSTREG